MYGLNNSGPSFVRDVVYQLQQVRAGKNFPMCAKYVCYANVWGTKRLKLENEEIKKPATGVIPVVENEKSVYNSLKTKRGDI